MNEVSVNKIRSLANRFNKEGNKWHFHILTPECQLNDRDDYALVLESAVNNKSYVCYSKKPYMNIGEELVKLLHGDDVIKDKKDGTSVPSSKVEKLLKRAKELNEKGHFWPSYVVS
ncbi:MAG: hypothetical protein PVJ52_02980 [Candidatus Woesebacteria bacterium]|jgi:hypothetical protein